MRGMGILRMATTAAVAGTLVAAASASAGTLDQQQTDVSFNSPDGFPLVGNPPGAFNQSGAQVFTAGISGALDQVDLSFNKSDNPPNPTITVEIRSASGGTPGGNAAVLATATIPGAGIGAAQAFVPVTIAPAVPVCAGTQYAIVAYNAGSAAGSFGWGQSPSVVMGNPFDAYPAGGDFNSPDALPPNTTWNPGPGDLAFKTYVVPGAPCTPPPSLPASPIFTPAADTGQRAAALKKCKKKKSKKARRKCRKRASALPK
jgi:hypothetical protein